MGIPLQSLGSAGTPGSEGFGVLEPAPGLAVPWDSQATLELALCLGAPRAAPGISDHVRGSWTRTGIPGLAVGQTGAQRSRSHTGTVGSVPGLAVKAIPGPAPGLLERHQDCWSSARIGCERSSRSGADGVRGSWSDTGTGRAPGLSKPHRAPGSVPGLSDRHLGWPCEGLPKPHRGSWTDTGADRRSRSRSGSRAGSDQ